MRTYNIVQKVCLLGAPAVGKTSLVRRFVLDQFDDRYITTVGTKVTKRKLKLTVPERNMDVELTLMLWDISGQKKASPTMNMYLKGSRGALIVGDITRPDTISAINVTYDSLIKDVGRVPAILLANKCDLVPDKVEAVDSAHSLVSALKLPFYATSAKTGENVENAFAALGDQIIRDMMKKTEL